MTSKEKSKEDRLKDKYDDSDMKKNMKDQYGEKEGEKVYYATIRKQAMKEGVLADRLKKITKEKKEKWDKEGKKAKDNAYKALDDVKSTQAAMNKALDEGVVDLVKRGLERDKKAKEKKKIKDRKAVPYAALAAETELEGEVIDERVGGAGTLVRQGIKVGGKKGGRAVQQGTTAATQAGKAQVAKAQQGNQSKMVGTGRAEKIGAFTGGAVGGAAGMLIPDGAPILVPAGEIAGGYVGSKIGGKIGRQIDKIGAKKPVTTEAIERQAKDRKKLSQPHSVDGSRRDHSHDVDSAMTDHLPRKGKGRIRPASKKEMRTSAMRDAGMTTEGVQSAISNLLARKKKENKKPTPPTGAEAKIQKWRQERKKEEHNKYVNFLDPDD